MKLKYSLISRRQFLNTLFGGSLVAFFSGSFFSLAKFAFPTLGKEPDFVVLAKKDFADIPNNSAKIFAWGGVPGIYLKKEDGSCCRFERRLHAYGMQCGLSAGGEEILLCLSSGLV